MYIVHAFVCRSSYVNLIYKHQEDDESTGNKHGDCTYSKYYQELDIEAKKRYDVHDHRQVGAWGC